MAPHTQSEHARDGVALLVDLHEAQRRLALVVQAINHLCRAPVVDLVALHAHRRLLGEELRAAWSVSRRIFESTGPRRAP